MRKNTSMVHHSFHHMHFLTQIFFLFLAAILLSLPVFCGPLDFLQAVAKDMIEGVVGGSLNDNSLAVLTSNPLAEGGGGIAMTIAEQVIRPLATSILSLCFTVKLAQTAVDFEHVTAERLFTPLLQYAGCLLLIQNWPLIMNAMVQAGVQTAISIRGATAQMLGYNIASMTAQMAPDLDTEGHFFTQLKEIWNAAGIVVRLFLPYVAYRIVSLLTKTVCYGVVIEVSVRSALFPMFVGDVMLHGFDGQGFHIAKSFLAACFQGAVVLLISAISNGLCYTALGGITGNGEIGSLIRGIGKVILFDFAGLSLMLKSSEIVKDAFGAR